MIADDVSDKIIDVLYRILDTLDDIYFEVHQINVRATNYDTDV